MLRTTTPVAPLTDIVAACRTAQRSWAALPVRQRLGPVAAVHGLLVEACQSLCAAVAQDLGKPAEETLAGEILPLASACRFLRQQANRLLRPRRVPAWHTPVWLWGQKDVVYRRPRGVVGIIGTWNFPLLLNGVQILQAITAGNGVVWKPSEVAPSSADALIDLLRRAGFPADLIQKLPATREAGPELANAEVDHIIFTGSSITGRRLAEHLGRRLVSSTLELSGCDAFFVLEDANVNLAARAAWFGATLNRGQTCIAARRVLVDRRVYPAFLEALRPLAAKAASQHLALESQVDQAERLVNAALAEGARLLEAGPIEEKNGERGCYKPTVVLDARPEMAICQEAPFAPLMAVLPFDSLEDALAMEAQCPYALGAAVFTNTSARPARLTPRLRAGMVAVNDVIVPTAHPATPFGGTGASGWGFTQGAEGLLEMTVPQVVSVRGGTFRPHYGSAIGQPPMTAEGFRGLLEWTHGATLRQRLGGLLRLVRGIRRP
jgi:acyl-CoA reductase-like NAD-dependent aldehyde dehydrogenase